MCLDKKAGINDALPTKNITWGMNITAGDITVTNRAIPTLPT